MIRTGKSLKIIVARCPKREVGHLAIGVRKMNLAFPNVRAQGSGAYTVLDPDIVVDKVLQNVEEGPVTGLERDVATRIPDRVVTRVTTSKRLALRGSMSERSTERSLLLVEMTERQGVP